jgi:hypothetical protein
MADADYIAVLDKHKATIYDATTTTITASANPIVVAPQYQTTGLWKLDQDAAVQETQDDTIFLATAEMANAIFDLPNNQQTVLYHHAAAVFSPKETFLDTDCAGNYATRPGLTTQHNWSTSTFLTPMKQKRVYMKGQRQGVGSTRQKTIDYIVAKEKHIKIEPGAKNANQSHIKWHEDMFIKIVDLANTIYSDQTGAFPLNSQHGNRYIIFAIHIDANYIFCKPMKTKWKVRW